MPNRITACGCSVPKGTKCVHEQASAKQRQASNDAERGTPAQRGYDADWSKIRFRFLHHHPTCCVCGAKATHVDHIKSIREAPELRLVESNLRAMCLPCHSRRTAKDQSQAWGKPKAA
ncbi:HNH endonuclease [Mesorhizobium sp. M0757]|uniref:HNH endonuclease n=1 Tax=Mesorhizobium sp. M0757 TaxID=2956993 RepID=UPI0033381C95